MKAFHGTNSKFNEFSLSYLGQNTDEWADSDAIRETAHLGFWFTENHDSAADVYESVMECELNICNPLEVGSIEELAFWLETQELTGMEIREKLMDQGYDSIAVEFDEEFKGRSFVVFSPSDICLN